MDKIEETINKGGVALLPTDTVYGLMASPHHAEAVAKIFALKGRPQAKKLPVLVSNTEQIYALGVRLDERIKALLASRFVLGALTMVLPLRTPVIWLEGRSEVALRIPLDVSLRALIHETGPLLATSANASGREPPAEVPDILAQLTGAPDIIVDDGPRTSQPSTLIDTQTTPFTVLRRGALSDEDLAEILAL